MSEPLTPEEWESLHTTLGDNPKLGIFARAYVRERFAEDNVDTRETHVLAIQPPRTLDVRGIVCDAGQRHALAALALHGQDFGFDHADVKCLRAFLAQDDPGTQAGIAMNERLYSLAARIEALLPPEVTP